MLSIDDDALHKLALAVATAVMRIRDPGGLLVQVPSDYRLARAAALQAVHAMAHEPVRDGGLTELNGFLPKEMT
jgi:hypothetical protein